MAPILIQFLCLFLGGLTIPTRLGYIVRLSFTTKVTKITKESENESLDSTFEPGVVGVDEEPDIYVSQFQVGQQMGLRRFPSSCSFCPSW